MIAEDSPDIAVHCKTLREGFTIRDRNEALRRRTSSVSRAFRRRPELAALTAIIEREGGRGWIVGGAPRDRLLGRRETDLDVALSGDAEAVARELEALGFGRAVPISPSAPRVFRVAGRRDLDIAELEESSIEADLARRDFTANAIAIDLSTGAWLDPYGGISDIARRRLRLVRVANLDDDPLRGFRAARLFATHGLRPDATTLASVRRIAPRVSEAAPERATAELAKLLESDPAAAALRWAANARVLAPALGLEKPRSAWRRALRILARLDSRLHEAARESRVRLRLAAIASALGLAPEDAAKWLLSRRHGRREAALVARLLELTRSAVTSRDSRERWRWVCEAGPLAVEATTLLEAAEPRRKGTAARLRRLAGRPRKGPRIRGGDVIAWLPVPAGPEVGRLLREVEIEIRRGALRSRAQARRWLEMESRRT